MAIVIGKAIKGFARRALAHVCQKVRKLFPAFTDRNPSSTVVWPTDFCRSGTSVNHARPRSVGWAENPVERMTMFVARSIFPETVWRFADFFSIATTAFRVALSEIIRDHYGFGVTEAATQPTSIAIFRRRSSQNREASVCVAR